MLTPLFLLPLLLLLPSECAHVVHNGWHCGSCGVPDSAGSMRLELQALLTAAAAAATLPGATLLAAATPPAAAATTAAAASLLDHSQQQQQHCQ